MHVVILLPVTLQVMVFNNGAVSTRLLGDACLPTRCDAGWADGRRTKLRRVERQAKLTKLADSVHADVERKPGSGSH